MNGLNLHNLRIYKLFKIVVDHEPPLIYNLFGLINWRHTSYPTDQDPLQLLSTGEKQLERSRSFIYKGSIIILHGMKLQFCPLYTWTSSSPVESNWRGSWCISSHVQLPFVLIPPHDRSYKHPVSSVRQTFVFQWAS